MLRSCEQAEAAGPLALPGGPVLPGASSSAVPTIAIVDDDSVQLSIYKKQFAKMGANVVTFSSGEVCWCSPAPLPGARSVVLSLSHCLPFTAYWLVAYGW